MAKTTSPIYLTLCRGLPASGKTTWAKQQVDRSFGSTVHVSRDDIRDAYYNTDVISGVDKNKEESLITKLQHETVRRFLTAKKNVIVDDLNLSERSVEGFYRLAQEFGGSVQMRFQDFEVPLAKVIAKDLNRGLEGHRMVGWRAIQEIADRYMHGGHELPALDAKYYSRIDPIPALKQDASLPTAWIVDIDGTIAMVDITDPKARSHYDMSRVDEDSPVEHAIMIVQALKAAGHRILIVSGRKESGRLQTLEWLKAFDVPFDELIMRKDDDDRADDVLKSEIYHEHIEGTYFVGGCIDDRKKVVDMWRSKGLFVAQVSPGLF